MCASTDHDHLPAHSPVISLTISISRSCLPPRNHLPRWVPPPLAHLLPRALSEVFFILHSYSELRIPPIDPEIYLAVPLDLDEETGISVIIMV